MKRFRLIGVALLAVFALGVLASASQAETAPSFTIGGTRLIAGKTHNFDVRQFGANNYRLTSAALTVECKGQSVEEGVLLGSNAGLPGKDNEIVVFTGCELIAGNGFPNCKLTSTIIKTQPLKSEQVENVVNSKAGKQLLEEFFPANTANGFVTLTFEGTECTVNEATVSGQTVGENLLDNSSEGKVELGQTPQERTSWLVKFPATPIPRVWLISGTEGKVQLTKQTAFGTEAVLTGTSLVLLASTKFVPEPNALWSPLP